MVFSHEALESRLAEVKSRGEAMLADIETLAGAGEAAESAIVQARQRLQQAGAEKGNESLQDQVREDELAAARKAVEYWSQVVALGATARTLL